MNQVRDIVKVGQSQEAVKISQVEGVGTPWYVSRKYDIGDGRETEYLHGDGRWRDETLFGNSYSGLFQNRDECLAAIARFEKIEKGQSVGPAPAPSRQPVSLAILEQKLMRIEGLKKKGHYDGSEDQ